MKRNVALEPRVVALMLSNATTDDKRISTLFGLISLPQLFFLQLFSKTIRIAKYQFYYEVL